MPVPVAVAVAMFVVSIVPVIVIVVLTTRFVLCGANEVHRPIAGIVLPAVLAPIPGMAGRHV